MYSPYLWSTFTCQSYRFKSFFIFISNSFWGLKGRQEWAVKREMIVCWESWWSIESYNIFESNLLRGLRQESQTQLCSSWLDLSGDHIYYRPALKCHMQVWTSGVWHQRFKQNEVPKLCRSSARKETISRGNIWCPWQRSQGAKKASCRRSGGHYGYSEECRKGDRQKSWVRTTYLGTFQAHQDLSQTLTKDARGVMTEWWARTEICWGSINAQISSNMKQQ